ncbi:MAG TPA: heme-binding protein [Ktedonobacterales bacterium]|nr:heme-binding protein [Ktedonobacterales bacterium]
MTRFGHRAHQGGSISPLMIFTTCDASVPDIAPLPGGVAIKAGDEIIAALAVAGPPDGNKDEICAQAGVASIQRDIASSLARER